MKKKIKEGGDRDMSGHWTLVWRRKTRKRKKKKRNKTCMDTCMNKNEMKGRKII